MSTRRLELIDPAAPPPPDVPRLRVAIATQDMKTLDAHFGSARKFAIYEVTPEGSRLLEALSFDAVSDGSATHAAPGDDRIGPKIDALAGCNLLFVLAIGGPAAARAVAARIHPLKVAGPEPIESVLARVQQMMAGTPPPWLRKAMNAHRSRPLQFLDAPERAGET